jgi:hypothetical protein
MTFGARGKPISSFQSKPRDLEHFALVIPALNEQDAIGNTLRRALSARQKVIDQTPIRRMTVVFVNDGSTDGTQQVVDQPEFAEVVKVRFAHNQGYGAAIKAGWQATDADLLGFIDADGTCDPDYCVPLIQRMEATRADVVLAARLGPQSKMPWIRRLGNVLFAKLLGVVSRKKLTDCASGFRIVRRSSLRLISPLPRGMHFTPAMSAICLLDPRLRIEEVPMPYAERIGRSKLSVLKDGLRFLHVILFTICCYTPLRTMITVAGIWSALVGLLLAWPASSGGSTIPSLLVSGGAIVALLTVYAGVICHQLNFLLIGPRQDWGVAERLVQRLTRYNVLIGTGLAALGVSLAWFVVLGLSQPGAGPMASAAATILMAAGAATALLGMIVRVIWAVGEKQKALLGEEYASIPHLERIEFPTPVLETARQSIDLPSVPV